MPSVNDIIADATVGHAIGLQRLSNATVRKIIATLRRSDARVFERLLSDDISALSRARQEALLKDIRRIIESVYEDATGQLRADLEALATYEGEWQVNMLERVVPVEVNWITPPRDQLVAVVNARPFQGRLLREWGSDLAEGAFKRVRDTIRNGIIEGRTTAEVVRDLRGTRAQGYKDGLIEIDRRHAEAVVRTAINHTATRAREETFKRNRKIIKGTQVLATLDTRTSAICMAADNRVSWAEGYSRKDFPEKTRFLADMPNLTNDSRPPFHINCRSTMMPIVKSRVQVKSTRASMDGQLPEDMTYEDWLRKKPADFQDDILGKSKGKLFREGGLTLDRFVSRRGDELTLDELRKKEADAWAKVFD